MILACWGGGEVAGAAGAAGLLGRDPPLLAIWTFGPLDHWDHWDHLAIIGPARWPWPSRAATQEHRPQPSTTVRNRPQHEIRSQRVSRRQLTESVRKRCDVSSFLRITHAANR